MHTLAISIIDAYVDPGLLLFLHSWRLHLAYPTYLLHPFPLCSCPKRLHLLVPNFAIRRYFLVPSRAGVCILFVWVAFYKHACKRSVLTICDRHNMFRNANVGGWVKHRLQCSGRGISLFLCIGSEVQCPSVFCFEEIEYENDISTPLWHYEGQLLSNLIRRLSSCFVH